jgi:hypothetical protein
MFLPQTLLLPLLLPLPLPPQQKQTLLRMLMTRQMCLGQ